MGNCLLSSDGRKVAFITRQYSTPYIRRRRSKEDKYTIWWMNADGSGLKEQVLNFPKSYFYDQLFAWPSSSNSIFLGIQERSETFKKIAYKILRVDLENGNHEILIEDIGTPYRLRVSPKQNYLTTRVIREKPIKGSIVLVNLRTFEKTIVSESGGYTEWNPNENKIVFSKSKGLWVYYLDENKARKIIQTNYDIKGGFDWLSDGKRLAVVFPEYGENYLKIFGEDFKEEKSIKIPLRILDPQYIWGVKDAVLIKGPRKGRLWRVDLESEKWKKVY